MLALELQTVPLVNSNEEVSMLDTVLKLSELALAKTSVHDVAFAVPPCRLQSAPPLSSLSSMQSPSRYSKLTVVCEAQVPI